MAIPVIQKASIDFLEALHEHNNREWFNANKEAYTAAHNNLIGFADGLLTAMNTHDNIETPSGKSSLYRIYKDVRFSKDKTPYNTNWNGGFKRATRSLRGGYYFNIEPGNTFVMGGFFGPNADDMKRIRQDIEMNHEDWYKMLQHTDMVKTFGKMEGAQLTTAPRGYDKDHPAIGLLRYKQFLLKHSFTDDDICKPGFMQQMNTAFRKMRPFLDYMSEVLTTDANGLSLV